MDSTYGSTIEAVSTWGASIPRWCMVPKQESPSAVESFMDLPPSALVKVDREYPYYQDDDTSVLCRELLLAKLLSLSVVELSEQQNPRLRDDEWSPSP
jgi:hypothetical protein